jgi:hypothetical protein
MPWPDRLRLPFSFDPQALQRDLAALAAVDWTSHFVKQNYEGDWSVIPLRGLAGETHPIRMIYSDPIRTDYVATPFLEACTYLQEVLAAFQCPLTSVRLMKLAPGSVIKEHSDHDLAAEDGKARIHIPVTSNPDVEFKVNGVPVPLALGETWYLRLSDPHTVANRGETDRVHLVIDARVDDWLRGQMDLALAHEDAGA